MPKRAASPTPLDISRLLPLSAEPDEIQRQERTRQLASRLSAPVSAVSAPGKVSVYVPPARLRMMAMGDGPEMRQKSEWEALRKSINGCVNKVSISNIKNIASELLEENLLRGRGLFCRSIMKAQSTSLPFTPVFASLAAVVNSKIPECGELLVHRLISQFKRSYRRNDKAICQASATFLAHLANQLVINSLVIMQMLLLLLSSSSSDGVELAVSLTREIGDFLQADFQSTNLLFERFRTVLHEAAIEKRVQYMIEVLFQVRKDKFKDHPRMPDGLDLVEEDEQITHDFDVIKEQPELQEMTNVFSVDPKYEENESEWAERKKMIFGSEDGSSNGESGDEDGDEEGSDEDEEAAAVEDMRIEDATDTNSVNLRRTIYLTIMNSLSHEEAVHKLSKINFGEGKELELCNMIIECCSQERTYSKFFGLIGERFCKLRRDWAESYQQAFVEYYEKIHRYETNRLRNIARFFGHLLATDGISWSVFQIVHMNEDETTSSSRIFVKFLLQEMKEAMSAIDLANRFKEPEMRPFFQNIFPLDNPKNTRFSINFFTSIELGLLTESMREHLANAPKLMMEQRRAAIANGSVSSDSSDSSSSSDSDSDSSSGDSSQSDSSRGSSRSRNRHRRRSSSVEVRRKSPSRGERSHSIAKRSARSRSPRPLGQKDNSRLSPARRDQEVPYKNQRPDHEFGNRRHSRSPVNNLRPRSRSPVRRSRSRSRHDRSRSPVRKESLSRGKNIRRSPSPNIQTRSPYSRRRSPSPSRRRSPEYHGRQSYRSRDDGRRQDPDDYRRR